MLAGRYSGCGFRRCYGLPIFVRGPLPWVEQWRTKRHIPACLHFHAAATIRDYMTWSDYLLAAVAVLYAGGSVFAMVEGNEWRAVCLACFAVSNVALMKM